MIGILALDLDGAKVVEGQYSGSEPRRFLEFSRTRKDGIEVPFRCELTAERDDDGRYIYRELHPELDKFTDGYQPGRKRASYRPN